MTETIYFSIKDSQSSDIIPIIKEVYPEAWRGAGWNHSNDAQDYGIVFDDVASENLKSETSQDLFDTNPSEEARAGKFFNKYNIYYNGRWRKIFKVIEKPKFKQTKNFPNTRSTDYWYDDSTGNGDSGFFHTLHGHSNYSGDRNPKKQIIDMTINESHFSFNRKGGVNGSGWIYWRMNTDKHTNTTKANASNLTSGRVLIIENEDILPEGGSLSTV